MIKKIALFLTLIVILISCSTQSQYQVYYNAKVHTSDKDNPTATAFVVENGKFIYVGNDEEALKYGAGTDMQGKRIIAGIVDSHCHLIAMASSLATNVMMFEYKDSKEGVLNTLRESIKEEPWKSSKFIVGVGFGPNAGQDLLSSDLDSIVADRPVMLISVDGHSGWANSKAFEIAGITPSMPDPQPNMSYYVRNESGNPTGFIVEIMAINHIYKILFNSLIDSELLNRFYAAIPAVMYQYNKNGHTACFDSGFMIDERTALEALKQVESNGGITLKVASSYLLNSSEKDLDGVIKKMKQLRNEFKSDMYDFNTLKLYIDGTLEVGTALMEEPYLAPRSGTGVQLLDYQTMATVSKLATNEGFNIHSHVIGDKAINLGLKLYEELGKIKGTKTLAHVEVMPVGGVERFATQGDIFYQTTPYWFELDTYLPTVLGPERTLRVFPLASLKKKGVTLCFGSDSSGDPKAYNPFFISYLAVNRAFDSKNIIGPQSEAITIEDCIDGYTIAGAQSIGWDDRIGSITKGKCADFVILNQDILTIECEKIKDVSVDMTFVNGKCVYDSTKEK